MITISLSFRRIFAMKKSRSTGGIHRGTGTSGQSSHLYAGLSTATARDICIVSAPCWTLPFLECHGIQMLNFTIDNLMNIPNCNGMCVCV